MASSGPPEYIEMRPPVFYVHPIHQRTEDPVLLPFAVCVLLLLILLPLFKLSLSCLALTVP